MSIDEEQVLLGQADIKTTKIYVDDLSSKILNAAIEKTGIYGNKVKIDNKAIDLNKLTLEDLEKYLKLKKAMDLLLKK